MYPHPGYEALWTMNRDTSQSDGKDDKFNEIRKILTKFDRPEGIEIYDRKIPGLNDAPEIPIRIYKKEGIENAPIVVNVHGGGWVSGDLDNDNTRAAYLAMNVPCIVVSVEYRLAPKYVFPAQIEDCYAALNWAYGNATELGGDKERIGLFGTSAGANLCAGLSLYVRDKGGPKISLAALNVPAVSIGPSLSAQQLFDFAPVLKGSDVLSGKNDYLGGYDGTPPSYYAFPDLAKDLSGIAPTLIIVAEYDPLRSQGISYAVRLMENAVPTELYCMPRVGHGFDMVNAPMTTWIRDGVCASFRREFQIG